MVPDETDTLSFDDIGAKLSAPQERLLAVAADADGGIPTPQLRGRAEVPSGSASYYLDPLVEWGLLELTGTRDTGNPIPSNVYAITERGRAFLERPSAAEWATAEDIQQVNERLDELERNLKATQVVMNQELGVDALEQIKEIREQL